MDSDNPLKNVSQWPLESFRNVSQERPESLRNIYSNSMEKEIKVNCPNCSEKMKDNGRHLDCEKCKYKIVNVRMR